MSEGYFTIGRNTKRHFGLSSSPDINISMISEKLEENRQLPQQTTPVVTPTPEPEEFENAFKDALWDPSLSKEDKEAIMELCRQFPMVFAHGSRQLGDVTTMEFDIQLTVKDRDQSRTETTLLACRKRHTLLAPKEGGTSKQTYRNY